MNTNKAVKKDPAEIYQNRITVMSAREVWYINHGYKVITAADGLTVKWVKA